jgi:CDP-diacylglycerol---serine O-phosphatidyltransferase
MPIPAGAGVIAAVVHFSEGDPIASLWSCITWALIIIAAGYLMVSTWRFYSFKGIDFRSRHPFRLVVLLGLLFAAIWFFSQYVLFIIALTYMASGVVWRLQWIFRRKGSPPSPPYKPVSQIS